MKTVYIVLGILLNTFGTMCFANSVNIDGIDYNLSEDGIYRTATISKIFRPYYDQSILSPHHQYINEKYSGDIIIPAFIEYDNKKYEVVIDSYAFYGCINITSVTIEEGLNTIPVYAFHGCANLERIQIPSTIKTIDDFAFSECKSLKNIYIPDSVSYIGIGIISGCQNINEIIVSENNPTFNSTNNCNAIMSNASNCLLAGCFNSIIPENTVKIGAYAFTGCDSLKDIALPTSLEIIDDYAFANSGLKQITFPLSLTEIGEYAFSNTALQSISIPSNVKSLYSTSFTECKDLSNIEVSIENPYYDSRNKCNAIIRTNGNVLYLGCKNTVIPDDTETITAYSFYGGNIDSLFIPASIKNIEINALGKCNQLTSIIVDERNNTFDSRDNCNAIIKSESSTLILGCQTTIIPKSVKTIGTMAFSHLETLNMLEFPEGLEIIDETAFYYSSISGALVFPSTLIKIGNGAFAFCNNITKVVIPSELEYLGWASFYFCEGIVDFQFTGLTPPVNSDYFLYDIYSPQTIKIPVGSLVAYQKSGIGDYFYNPYYYEEYTITSVNNVLKNVSTTPTYYDLQGRRVDNPQSGLYIKDGKKVFIE